jgi:hypothetical protein
MPAGKFAGALTSLKIRWIRFCAIPLSVFVLSMKGGSGEPRIKFEDVTAESGIHFVVDNSETEQRFQVEPMIAGVGLLDFNNDGLLDIFFCNGADIWTLEKNEEKYSNRLYMNQGDFKFSDVTATARIRGQGYSMGAAAGDYDNDGWTDLYVTGVNRNILYRNLGNGRFENVTNRAGVTGSVEGRGKLWSVGAGWFDFDNDGDLDLFVVNYCVWSRERDSRCGADKPGYRTYCHPKMYEPLPNLLYRNEGDGTFTDVSMKSGVGDHLGKGMGLAFADFDSDGYLDAFVSNDAWRNFLFRNLGTGRFEEIGMEAGVAYTDSARPVSGMGADAGDYDGDTLPDIFMTALSNETFPIFRNLGNRLFRDDRFQSGLGVDTLPWSGWSLGLVDLDNDSDLDLFTAGGHVQTNEELYTNRPSLQTNRVFENLGNGRFEDVTVECEGLTATGLHRGAAFGDLDNDGLLDVVVTRLNAPAEVLRNTTESAGDYLLLQLEGKRSNRSGLGSEVRVKLDSGQELVRMARTAVGYGGSSDPRVHVGLGSSALRSVNIVWPGGKTQTAEGVRANTLVRVKESSGD